MAIIDFINFVDFEKAFDSLDRNILWKLLQHNGIPIKLVNIIKCMYDGSAGQVIANGKLTDALHIKSGVRHGCLVSQPPFPHCHRLDNENVSGWPKDRITVEPF